METKKTFRIGTLRTGESKNKDESGETVVKPSVYLALGDMNNKDPKYNHSVELIVRNSAGEVVLQQTNGFVNLDDPRLGKFGRVTPDFIRYELKASKK